MSKSVCLFFFLKKDLGAVHGPLTIISPSISVQALDSDLYLSLTWPGLSLTIKIRLIILFLLNNGKLFKP